MMHCESDLRKFICDNFYIKNQQVAYPIENSMVPGMPDILLNHSCNQSFFIETKFESTSNTKITFQRLQPKWIRDHKRMGGECLIFVLVSTHVYIYKSEHVPLLQQHKLAQVSSWMQFNVVKEKREFIDFLHRLPHMI